MPQNDLRLEYMRVELSTLCSLGFNEGITCEVKIVSHKESVLTL